jgi:hypothetical protein
MGELTSKEKFFVERINWRLLWFVNVALSTLWIGLAAIIPDSFFKPIAIVVMAFQNMFLAAMRGEKYLRNRELDPPKEII